jgi:nucleoside-diphosphate-sugar epimerase/CBS domain-containing protein
MINKNIKKHTYKPTTPLKKVASDLYNKKLDICLICDKNQKLIGLLTLTDIKKAIFNGIDPNSSISETMNRNFIFGKEKMNHEELEILAGKENIHKTGLIEKVPIVNSKKQLIGLFTHSSVNPNNMHKSVLITGGAGYMGSILCRKLLDKGYQVTVLDKLLFGKESIKELIRNKDFKFIKGEMGSINNLLSGIQKSDSVIHLAGIVGDPASSLDPVYTMESNHFSTKLLIELAKYYHASRFIFASSCSVYGANKNVLTEKSSLNPLSLYARTKVSSEKDLLNAQDRYFHPIILRFGTLYGLSPRMRFDLAINTMTAHGFFRNKINVTGGSQYRPFLDVSDAAEACIKALEAPLKKVAGQIFNVGSNKNNLTINEVANIIKATIPQTKVIRHNKTIDKRDYNVSFDKIRKLMSFQAANTVKSGVEKIVSSFQNGQYKDFENIKYSNYLLLKTNEK